MNTNRKKTTELQTSLVLLFLLVTLCVVSCRSVKTTSGETDIVWKDSLHGDFSFTTECSAVDAISDEIAEEHHTLQSTANLPEWSGADFMIAQKNASDDSIFCYTLCNAATHCSLEMILYEDKCYPRVVLNSVAPFAKPEIFSCTGGEISIDRSLWKREILKARFRFIFKSNHGKSEDYFWEGRIYTPIFRKVAQRLYTHLSYDERLRIHQAGCVLRSDIEQK